ncbi:hypothetical protein, partial [Bradyrhizobium sp. F1.13.3]|uniref:hypothetical protein n=1 Tax=Bradyrhizobium sp. F1.13.3 TaxID=3156351 RepID=UPI0033918634
AHDNLRGNHYFAATLTRHPDCRAFPSRSTRYSRRRTALSSAIRSSSDFSIIDSSAGQITAEVAKK